MSAHWSHRLEFVPGPEGQPSTPDALIAWARAFDTPEAAWAACERGDWLLFVLEAYFFDDHGKALTRCTVDAVERAVQGLPIRSMIDGPIWDVRSWANAPHAPPDEFRYDAAYEWQKHQRVFPDDQPEHGAFGAAAALVGLDLSVAAHCAARAVDPTSGDAFERFLGDLAATILKLKFPLRSPTAATLAQALPVDLVVWDRASTEVDSTATLSTTQLLSSVWPYLDLELDQLGEDLGWSVAQRIAVRPGLFSEILGLLEAP